MLAQYPRSHYPQVALDYFVIMPNHVHGIIMIDNQWANYSPNNGEKRTGDNNEIIGEKRTGHALSLRDDGIVGTRHVASDKPRNNNQHVASANEQKNNQSHPSDVRQPNKPRKKHTIGNIVGSYKSAVTKLCRQIDPHVRLWQPRYHDKIIRTENALNALRQYVLSNPAKWSEDEHYRETNQ